MSVLTDLASLRRAFFRLTATDENDPALIEQDVSDLEAVDQFLQYGAWDAQAFLIDNGMADRWVTTSAALSWSGADASDGGRYTSLPSDFLRLAGDDQNSALRVPGGRRWGLLIDFENRWVARGDCYWLMNDQLWIAYAASPPTGLKMDYHHKLATLAVGTTVDFPAEHAGLIVGYAGGHAMNEAWLPEDEVMRARIVSKLGAHQKEAQRRIRRTAKPRTMKTSRTQGATHW